MQGNKMLHMISFILLLVGGLNWGLVGIGGFLGGNWNLVYIIFGAWPMVELLVYVLVGLAAVYELATHKASCRACTSAPAPVSGSGMM